MITISLSREQVISTVEFIVEQYEQAQASRFERVRAVINPSVMDFHGWSNNFLNDWSEVRAKIQGISLLFSDASDSYGMDEYFECSKDKVTDLWRRCGIELIELQHPVNPPISEINNDDDFFPQSLELSHSVADAKYKRIKSQGITKSLSKDLSSDIDMSEEIEVAFSRIHIINDLSGVA